MQINSKVIERRFENAYKFVSKLNEVGEVLKETWVEREECVASIMNAILTKQHLLLMGPPGTAKSDIVRTLFRIFDDAQLFTIEVAKSMMEERFCGNPNIKVMRETGRIEFMIEHMLPTAHFAFLEELLDGNAAVLRATLLGMLNERTFRPGSQAPIKCPLHTAIATTNFSEETEQTAAVLDRFLLKMWVTPVEEDSAIIRMFESSLAREKLADGEVELPHTFSLQELGAFHQTLAHVTIETEVLEVALRLMREFVRQSSDSIYLSDRRKVQCLRMIKVAALSNSRSMAQVEDLENMRGSIITIGAEQQETWWQAAFKKEVGNLEKVNKFKTTLNTIRSVLSQIKSEKVANCTEQDILRLSKNVKTVINTLEKRDVNSLRELPEIESEFVEQLSSAKKINEDLLAAMSALLK